MGASINMYNSSNLSQQLNLAPQLLNWLKLLQASSLELEQLVKNELDSNPVLEVAPPEEGDSFDDFSDVEIRPSAETEMRLDGSDFDERLGVLSEIDAEWREADNPPLECRQALQDKHDFMMDHLATPTALHEDLAQAIRFSELDAGGKAIAEMIAGSIDCRGYLDADLEEIARLMEVEPCVVEEVLVQFQRLAPPGVGARDLRECLVLQLAAIEGDTELAQMLVRNWLENLAMHQEAEIAKFAGVEYEDVVEAFALIRTLDPEPGRSYQVRPVEYVEADMEIRCRNGELEVVLLEDRLPSLRISSYCQRLIEARQGSKNDLDYIRGKLREANFLIQGISQRQETMLKVAREIMRGQREFLASDEGQLRPLTMNKVAAMIGVHETTVSRAIANKYIRTDRGLLEMRSFFKVGYRCADGSSVTPERVKEQLVELVRSEDSLKPMTDAHVSEWFKKKGLKVARRTVAKYREEVGIPSSKERLIFARRMNVSMDIAV